MRLRPQNRRNTVSRGRDDRPRRSRSAGRHRRGNGFSLVELIIVIVLVGILAVFGSLLLTKVFSSYSLERNVGDADWQAKVALERMARELRAVRTATATDLDISSGVQIRFIDMDGNGVCFYRDAATGRLMRSGDGPASACGTTSPQPLAGNVTALNFSYWDNAAAPTTAVASVYYITVSVTVVEGSYNASFRTNVWPRNF